MRHFVKTLTISVMAGSACLGTSLAEPVPGFSLDDSARWGLRTGGGTEVQTTFGVTAGSQDNCLQLRTSEMGTPGWFILTQAPFRFDETWRGQQGIGVIAKGLAGASVVFWARNQNISCRLDENRVAELENGFVEYRLPFASFRDKDGKAITDDADWRTGMLSLNGPLSPKRELYIKKLFVYSDTEATAASPQAEGALITASVQSVGTAGMQAAPLLAGAIPGFKTDDADRWGLRTGGIEVVPEFEADINGIQGCLLLKAPEEGSSGWFILELKNFKFNPQWREQRGVRVLARGLAGASVLFWADGQNYAGKLDKHRGATQGGGFTEYLIPFENFVNNAGASLTALPNWRTGMLTLNGPIGPKVRIYIAGIEIYQEIDPAPKKNMMSSDGAVNEVGDVAFFVAPAGNDANDGSKNAPFATLERARDAVRELRKNQESAQAMIYLRGGIYTRRNSFALNRDDSGTSGSPLLISAYRSEKASILGGAQLAVSDFSPVKDEATLARLPEEARGKVLQANLRAIGITDYGELPLYGHGMHALNDVTLYKSGPPMPELFFNGKPMTLARWPNEDYARIEKIVDMGSIPRNWQDDAKNKNIFVLGQENGWVPPEERPNPPNGFSFTMKEDRLLRWTQAEDPWMFGYWYWDWSDQSVQIKAVKPESRTLEAVQPSCYGLKVGQRFYAYNMIEELDVPGEWYLDRKAGVLYFYPPTDDPKALVQISLCAEPLVKIVGASHIILRGLSLGVARASAVSVTDGEGVRIERCDIGLLGSGAVTIDGGKEHGVADCVIHDTGAGGITLTGGDRQTLEPAGHYAEYNEIRNFSRIVKTYSPAIGLAGVGNRAIGNSMSGGPHTAVLFRGNDHLIEGNEIFDVCRETDDMGAIYSGRDGSARGTIIRNNYIHDILSDSGAHCGSHALYLDDGISGTEFSSNLVVNISGMGVLINGGRDNRVLDNVFVRARAAVAISDFFMDNRFGDNAPVPMEKGIDHTSEPYRKYPNLANLNQDQPRAPKYNVVTGNRYYGTKPFHHWKFRTDNTEADIRAWNTIDANTDYRVGPRLNR